MLAEVRRTIAREGLLEPEEPVWAAVSGGVDSMVLLHVLRQLGHPCRVAHVDHGLRGAESDADRAFVEAYARREGIPYRCAGVDVREAAPGGSVQMAARQLRYASFKEWLREGPHAMALGHHRDDAVETLAINLLRGIGARGWKGIPPVTELPEGRLVRPLLGVGRDRIMAYAREHGIPFREDSSNAAPKYLRNRVRAELLPLLEDLRPGARDTMARASLLLRELAAAAGRQVEQEAARLPGGPDPVSRIPLGALRESGSPRLLLMHLLRGLHPHPDLVEQLLEAVREGATGARFRSGGRRITVEADAVVLDEEPASLPIFTISGAGPGQGGPFSWATCMPGEVDFGRGMATAWLDKSKLAFPLQLRPWRHGDRMRPVGLRGSKLVSDILTDAGLPRNGKEKTYVLADGNNEVIWVAGLRVAQGFPPGPDTQEVLRVTWAVP